ncbi:FTR1 family iron permease [Ramlibacter sp. PS4R-6]|uniref:FTR1 family iron permease n=1 Tax=Ramlibacter sp. PS4R-6 TaxID=3133438 RepID=UPI0030AE2A15
MFAAALIVFRESLEAALFIGIVAAATRGLPGRGGWLGAGVAIGVVGALILAALAPYVSEMAGGMGQDMVNIVVLSVALAMLLWHCIWVTTHTREMALEAQRLGASVQGGERKPWALLVAVALAVLREGAETVLFIAGSATGGSTSFTDIVLAVIIGVSLGGGIGAVIYAGLARVPTRHIFTVTNVLIAILAGSIASQLVKSLAQAGFLEAWTSPVWDTSELLAPDSALGTFLKALMGYDATPSGAQLLSYAAVLAFIYAGTKFMRRHTHTPAR